jgi:hypothetical protein
VGDLQTSHNADTLARELIRAGEVLREGLEDVNAEAGRIVLARSDPPRATGALASSLVALVYATTTVLGSTVAHWTFVHWGTRFVRARPFLLAAVQATRSEVIDLYPDHARRTVGTIQG